MNPRVLSGAYEGLKITLNPERQYAYIVLKGEQELQFTPENVERYKLRPESSRRKDNLYVVEWVDGEKSLIEIPKIWEKTFIAGCETGPIGDTEMKRRNKSVLASMVPYIVGLAVFFGVIFWCLLSDSPNGTSAPRNEYEWANWDGTAANMPSANVPVYTESALSNGYGGGTITGVARNRTPNRFSYIQIIFGLYSSGGAKVGTCMTNLAGLSTGEDWRFEAFCANWPSGGSYKLEDVTYW